MEGEKEEVVSGRGCPQGGCLSPHLWILLVDELIGKLKEAGVYIQMYSDDGVIIIRGKHPQTVSEVTQSAVKILDNWCKEQGLNVNPKKTKVILFTKRRNTQQIKAIKMHGEELEIVKKIKYLGIILDNKLKWNDHIEYIQDKTMKTIWLCRRLIGKSWGLSPEKTRWIHKAIIKPKMAYGAVIWWEAIKKGKNEKKLNRIQRLMCLLTLGVMKTAPTAAMEIMLAGNQ